MQDRRTEGFLNAHARSFRVSFSIGECYYGGMTVGLTCRVQLRRVSCIHLALDDRISQSEGLRPAPTVLDSKKVRTTGNPEGLAKCGIDAASRLSYFLISLSS
jgi:hypothetical protein